MALRLPQGLPALSGRGLAAFRIIWTALLALAIIGLTAGIWAGWQRNTALDDAYYGAGLRQTAANNEVTFSPIGSGPTKAGIRPGSTLLAVDGSVMPNGAGPVDADVIAKSLGGPDGRIVRLTMRAPDGRTADHRVVRGPHHLAESDRTAPLAYNERVVLNLAMQYVVGLPMLAAAIMLYRRRVRDPVVALLSFGLLAFLAGSSTDLLPLGAGDIAGSIFPALAIGALLLGMLVFPSGRFEPRWSLLALPLLLAVMTGRWWAPDESQMIGLSLIIPLFGITLAAVARRYYLLAPGIERQQVKWAALGFAAFLLLGLCSVLLGMIDETTNDNRLHFFLLILLNIVSATSFLALIGGLLISLLRYRLYDAEAAISRSAVYAALTVSLLAIFAGTEKFIEILGEQYFGESIGAASGAVAAGLAAVMIAPMHKRMSDWAERRFQRGLVRLRRDLPLLVGDLRETSTPGQLAQTVLDRVAGIVRASSAALVMCNGEDASVLAIRGTDESALAEWRAGWTPPTDREVLDCDRRDAVFPIRVPLHADGAGTVGWIVLGPRPDGSFYGKDEREVLLEVADPVARGLAIAIQREAREAGLQETTASLTARLAAVEEALTRFLAGRRRKPA